MNALPYVWAVIGLPLLSAAAMLLFGRTLEPRGSRPSRWPGRICTPVAALSFVLALIAAFQLWSIPGHRYEVRGDAWFAGGEWGLLLDPLSLELMLLISGIGTLVHIYSTAYMHEDAGQYRFFGGLKFFIGMMQILVLANNYVLLFAGWEGVGLASYMLIGFYYQRWRAGVAAMKAFIINRAGDAGMILGILFLLMKTGSAHVSAVEASAAHWSLRVTLRQACCWWVRSASPLISSSYLVAGRNGRAYTGFRADPLGHHGLRGRISDRAVELYLFHAPEVSLATAILGIISAVLAASIALVENDIKRVLAYSTISQIGFMFVALGAGAYTAALFHLFTHAFFKSLLFLGAGSLIHALDGEQNLKHMGGLRHKPPNTFKTMLVASCALSAVPGFAGFFSKDAILGETMRLPNGWLFLAAGLLLRCVTAIYAWRLMFLAFYGEERQSHEHVHGLPLAMAGPMYLLAIGCVLSGWILPLIDWSEWPLMLVSGAITFGGIAIAWRYYVTSRDCGRHGTNISAA